MFSDIIMLVDTFQKYFYQENTNETKAIKFKQWKNKMNLHAGCSNETNGDVSFTILIKKRCLPCSIRIRSWTMNRRYHTLYLTSVILIKHGGYRRQRNPCQCSLFKMSRMRNWQKGMNDSDLNSWRHY